MRPLIKSGSYSRATANAAGTVAINSKGQMNKQMDIKECVWLFGLFYLIALTIFMYEKHEGQAKASVASFVDFWSAKFS